MGTEKPTEVPTELPTAKPTAQPTDVPTAEPTDVPTEEPTAEPTAVPTADPTAQPSVEPTEHPTSEPTIEPTAVPTVQPTRIPTADPTAEPTVTPTEPPTTAPTALPTFVPTSAPTELPTFSPSEAPTGCKVRAAKMHILFKENGAVAGRRLLMAMSVQAFKTHEIQLQAAVARQLHLSMTQLAIKSYQQANSIWHTELRFKGLEAIELGYQLEKAVLANQFNPIPQYPIHRLYMEEIFDCGEHAVGATHTYDGTNDSKNIVWSLPDSGWEHHTLSH